MSTVRAGLGLSQASCAPPTRARLLVPILIDSDMKAQKDPVALKFRLGDIASARDPRRAPWGYYCSDDHVSGVGLFLWFQTKEGLLQFLAEHEGADSEHHDRNTLRTDMRKFANQILAGRLGLEKGRGRLNKSLKGHLDIEWMGHFDELLSGGHPFAKKLRANFSEWGTSPPHLQSMSNKRGNSPDFCVITVTSSRAVPSAW